MSAVVLLSNQITGKVSLLRKPIMGATKSETFSAVSKPIRLGINSPKRIERKVTTITTSVVDMADA